MISNLISFTAGYLLMLGAVLLLLTIFTGINIENIIADPNLPLADANPVVEISRSQYLVMNLALLFSSLVYVYLYRVRIDKKGFLTLGYQQVKLPDLILIASCIALLLLLLFFQSGVRIRTIPFAQPANLIFTVVSCLCISISRELLFRGYLFDALKKQTSQWVSLFIPSLLFAATYVFLPGFNTLSFLTCFYLGY